MFRKCLIIMIFRISCLIHIFSMYVGSLILQLLKAKLGYAEIKKKKTQPYTYMASDN